MIVCFRLPMGECRTIARVRETSRSHWCTTPTGWDLLNTFHLWSFKAVRPEWFSVTLLWSGFKIMSQRWKINRLKRQSINLAHRPVSLPIRYSITVMRLWQVFDEASADLELASQGHAHWLGPDCSLCGWMWERGGMATIHNTGNICYFLERIKYFVVVVI